jgi:hypothetical protein
MRDQNTTPVSFDTQSIRSETHQYQATICADSGTFRFTRHLLVSDVNDSTADQLTASLIAKTRREEAHYATH